MASKMLIDAAHPEETRVAVVRGKRIEEFDYESASRRPLKGNIYLAKVTRVEPSLQAAFVEYGGNRHGFLAFSEIHPDYYQIPVADRQALLEAEAEDARLAREEEENEEKRPRKSRRRRSRSARAKDDKVESKPETDGEADGEETASEDGEQPQTEAAEAGAAETEAADTDNTDVEASEVEAASEETEAASTGGASDEDASEDASGDEADDAELEASGEDDDADADENGDDEVDTVAEDAEEETAEAAPKPRKRAPRKQYKIQEVIKRRQVLLIQVVKEERGNKGAALTTYLSLAGRYCVLMPNTARGGGISRKISDSSDRRRLKDMIKEIDVSEGMGLIVRTAGAQRTKTEIKRDYDYLLRMWESVRELTLESSAPTLVYEEGNLIKRSIRDLYSKDIDEVLVEGEAGYKQAKSFMKMLMPSHARNVKLYKDTRQLFTRYQVESQLDGLFTPTVTLPSGGYIVMNQTEALVSIDINSGKATREHSIEDTALKTNLEASVEIARQLRLRDLAGLIVIDFIDMEENRNNRAVERKLKDALKNDRARIQVGRISHFGLLEMSRQRLRQGMMESSTRQCPHCEGTGVIRAVSSCALSVLRSIEEHLLSRKPESLDVRVHPGVANYIFNEKRDHLLSLEQNYGISIYILPDPDCSQAEGRIERKPNRAAPVAIQALSDTAVAMGDELQPVEDEADADEARADAEDEDGEPRKKRRRRRGRRGGKRQREQREAEAAEAGEDGEAVAAEADADGAAESDAPAQEAATDDAAEGEEKPKRRRGRGRKKKADAEAEADAPAGEDAPASEDAATADATVEASEEAKDDDAKPAKKPRKRASKKAKVEDAADSDASDVQAASEDASADAPADDAEKPKRKPRKRAAKKAAPETKSEPVDASGNGADPVSAPVETAAPVEPEAPRWAPPAATVDPDTVPKKKGWFSRS